MSSLIKKTIIYFIYLYLFYLYIKKPQHSILKLRDIFVYLNLNFFTIFPKRDSLLSSDTRLLLLYFSSLFSGLISCCLVLSCLIYPLMQFVQTLCCFYLVHFLPSCLLRYLKCPCQNLLFCFLLLHCSHS